MLNQQILDKNNVTLRWLVNAKKPGINPKKLEKKIKKNKYRKKGK